MMEVRLGKLSSLWQPAGINCRPHPLQRTVVSTTATLSLSLTSSRVWNCEPGTHVDAHDSQAAQSRVSTVSAALETARAEVSELSAALDAERRRASEATRSTARAEEQMRAAASSASALRDQLKEVGHASKQWQRREINWRPFLLQWRYDALCGHVRHSFALLGNTAALT